MTTCARVVIVAVIAACHHTSNPRERALERLPGAADVVVAADGPALADPAFRRVIDASRTHVPTSFGCVIDAALGADAVALSESRTGILVAIAGHGTVARCPALSEVAPDVWVATIGDAIPVGRAQSVLAADRWARAARYLADAPVAMAADLGARHVIAAARPDPIELWIAIDAADADAADRELRALVAPRLQVTRDRDQVVARGAKIDPNDLLALATAYLDHRDAVAPAASALACPPADAVLVRCTGGTRYEVHSVAQALRAMTSARVEPVVASGEVIGVRLTEDARLGLRAGDVVLAVDSRRVKTAADLDAIAARAHGRAVVAVRRGAAEHVIELLE